jgi:serine/threonine-protein kinase
MVPANESNTTGAISDLLQTVRGSSILSERQFEKLKAGAAQGRYPSEPSELAASLVKDGVLTEYQARQVLKGKAQALIFGRYVLLDFLGKGTMGKVYKARHRMMGRIVALKILESQYVSNTRSLARFQREMQLVGRLDHPNVVRAFDADRLGDCHFIAMEYVPGPTLLDLLKERGALPPADVVFYASQAADGLAHAHARGVLHRDIKPSNLLLTEGRKIKVLDFGLGTLLEPEELGTSLTAVGITVGTPDYLSPEQARMVKIDGRSDLYSLGCSVYHLISGQVPFKGESSMDCIVGRITGQAVPISEVRPGLPQRLVQTIDKLMASNPDDRYQTADEAATALRGLLRPRGAAPARPAPAKAAHAAAAEPVTSGLAAAPKPVAKEMATVSVPVAKEIATLEAPSLPVRAGVGASKPKRVSHQSRWTARRLKANRVLAAVGVAAVSLIAVSVIFLGSSKDESATSHPSSSQTTGEPTVPETGAESIKGTNLAPSLATANKGTNLSSSGASAKKGTSQPAGGVKVRVPSFVIETPREGATVSMREDLTGRMESEGWPVIFVQADIPGQRWWCQAPVAKIDGGKFTTKVVFGDEDTRSGTRYRIAGIVTPNREEALRFDVGPKDQVLPEGFPQSAIVVVTHK